MVHGSWFMVHGSYFVFHVLFLDFLMTIRNHVMDQFMVPESSHKVAPSGFRDSRARSGISLLFDFLMTIRNHAIFRK